MVRSIIFRFWAKRRFHRFYMYVFIFLVYLFSCKFLKVKFEVENFLIRIANVISILWGVLFDEDDMIKSSFLKYLDFSYGKWEKSKMSNIFPKSQVFLFYTIFFLSYFWLYRLCTVIIIFLWKNCLSKVFSFVISRFNDKTVKLSVAQNRFSNVFHDYSTINRVYYVPRSEAMVGKVQNLYLVRPY